MKNVQSALRHGFAGISMLFCLAAASVVHAAGNAGMVLDLKGTASVQGKGGEHAVDVLDYLDDGQILAVPAGSSAQVSVYKTQKVYQLTGPSTVRVTTQGLLLVAGKHPAEVKVAETGGAGTKNPTGGLERPQAGVVMMRSIKAPDTPPPPVDQSPTNTNGAQK